MIAATGLEVLAFGDVEVVVDGEVMPPGSRLVYKSVMLSDVPNLAYVFGYANASWTLKVDLAAAWIAAAIAYMRSTGATKAVATAPIEAMPTRPMLDLAAGYVERAEGRFPRQGTGAWSVPRLSHRRAPAAQEPDRRRHPAVLGRAGPRADRHTLTVTR